MKRSTIGAIIIIFILISSTFVILMRDQQDSTLYRTMEDFFSDDLGYWYNHPESDYGKTFNIQDRVEYISVVSIPNLVDSVDSGYNRSRSLWNAHDFNCSERYSFIKDIRNESDMIDITWVQFESLEEHRPMVRFIGNRSQTFIPGKTVNFKLTVERYLWRDYYPIFVPPYYNSSWVNDYIYMVEPLYTGMIVGYTTYEYNSLFKSYVEYETTYVNNTIILSINETYLNLIPSIQSSDGWIKSSLHWNDSSLYLGSNQSGRLDQVNGSVHFSNGTTYQITHQISDDNLNESFPVSKGDVIHINYAGLSNYTNSSLIDLYSQDRLMKICDSNKTVLVVISFNRLRNNNLGSAIQLYFYPN